jgi:arsenite methyltransferase
MAIACPIDLDTRKLRDEIQSIYARVATDQSSSFHFHRGPDYAAELTVAAKYGVLGVNVFAFKKG